MYNRDFDLNQNYFEWLCDIVHADQVDRSWWLLMKDLHRRKFYALVPHDENRAEDGLDLRDEYIQDSWLPEYCRIEGDCSVLEMLIGLARRIDFETSDPYGNDQTDRTAYWFWEMVDNLGLMVFDDESYVEYRGFHHIDKIIDKFISRKYRRNGQGGLFPLLDTRKDQRQIEIWYQMSAYLAEREAV